MKQANQGAEKQLDVMIELLRNLLAIELFKGGVSKADIGKRLHVAKSSVVKMLRGYDEGKNL
jgi:predicted transcriptional regulator